MDKVQKIREEVERIQLYTQSEVLKQVLDYIDKVQKEPKPKFNKGDKIQSVGKSTGHIYTFTIKGIQDDCYVLDDDKVLTFNMQDSWELVKEPVSDDLEEAADVYSKVFSDIAAPNIRKDAFIAGANWQKQQDLIPSTELSNFIDKLSKQFQEVSFAKLSRIAVRVAKWQKEQEYTCYEEAFEDGAKWKAEQFEKNRLKHCNSITNEQAELEQGFIDQHIDKYQRMPTFLDAIEYGMQFIKKQMMKGAIDAKIGSFTNGTIYDADFNIDSNLKDNDKVKVIVIKED